MSSDNIMVAVVTNGLFGNANPFCQYLHPLLCLIIRGLSMLIPSADAFTVIKDLIIFGELALVFYLDTLLLYKSCPEFILNPEQDCSFSLSHSCESR